MLKDPDKKNTLDLNDPLIKAVNETLVQETDELTAEDPEPVAKNVARILPEREFVPFNPLVRFICYVFTTSQRIQDSYYRTVTWFGLLLII